MGLVPWHGHFAEHGAWSLMTFLLLMDKSTDSFQKSCNARVCFVLICFSRFFKNNFIFLYQVLCSSKAVDEGPRLF